MAQCNRAWDNYYWQNDTNSNLYNDNERLSDKVEALSKENDPAEKENRDYFFLKRIFGKKKMDDLMEQAKKIQKVKAAEQSKANVRKKSADRTVR